MTQPVTSSTPQAAPAAQDESISFEAHGFLNQSYDSLDALLHGLTHGEAALPAAELAAASAAPASAPEVTIVGQTDAVLPAHLFL
ncbi:hypothetical protein [Paraburkholderia unamae]|uniref:Uncharacterized protein n=1 Tax=Paraburkholderia unamae TaxID=219649 RepID=A0ABX5KJW9_9BURK|nr:hypothetical protein [Paraburkholderia unamae]PVX82160.1 hypothetical protein C7402_10913 [Paraburkholderia unamae]RAR60490.1 hypothetical protein C7401_10913 [Paraburkholderia unamae]